MFKTHGNKREEDHVLKKHPGETVDGQNPTQVGRCLRYLFRVSKNRTVGQSSSHILQFILNKPFHM